MKLSREYDYYQREKELICDRYLNRYIVIIGDRIVGDYETYDEAIKTTMKKHPLGTFLIQFVEVDEVPAYVPRMQVKNIDQ